ncbi:CsbD family protein [Streptomyces sp. NBC_01451]|uniref:CsbD family protein n=1 Tax=Streptomyces sp. NBC_01451 TaxID=2903872 RepID=UPI002E32260A|nr:CsbD family protein [Streptomyces sp. NBC_01451]
MVDKGRTDKIKGKVKELAGKATSDREQEQEGKLEQARGEAKKKRDQQEKGKGSGTR